MTNLTGKSDVDVGIAHPTDDLALDLHASAPAGDPPRENEENDDTDVADDVDDEDEGDEDDEDADEGDDIDDEENVDESGP